MFRGCLLKGRKSLPESKQEQKQSLVGTAGVGVTCERLGFSPPPVAAEPESGCSGFQLSQALLWQLHRTALKEPCDDSRCH